MDESAADSEEEKLAVQGHIDSGDSADNQVEGARVRQGPIRVAMNSPAPSLKASSFLLLERIFATTVSAPNAFYTRD